MTTTRRKSERIQAPTTLEDARAALAKLGALDRVIHAIETAYAERLQLVTESITAERDSRTVGYRKEIERLFMGLKAFSEANPEVFGKKRSLKIAEGQFGFRKATGRVVVPDADAEANAIGLAKTVEAFASLLKVDEKLVKNAVKDLPDNLKLRLKEETGITVQGGDEFFVKAADPGPVNETQIMDDLAIREA